MNNNSDDYLYVCVYFFQFKNGNLDVESVLKQSKDIQDYAKSRGIKVEESVIRNSVEDCAKKGKVLFVII